MRTYRTSEIAKIINIHPNTVMLYEKWGYIAPCERMKNGYRIYTETHLEQMKIARIGLRCETIKCYMRKEVVNIIRTSASGNLEKALELSKEYLAHIQKEKNNELEIVKSIKEIFENDVTEEEYVSLNRNEAAKLLGLSINIIINWERNGLLEVPRNKKNGYRVYTEKEIRLLKVIKTLRQESYSTQCILVMLNKLKTYTEEDLKEIVKGSNDRLLSSLAEAENDANELISYISKLIPICKEE